jgi:hypothetical protein
MSAAGDKVLRGLEEAVGIQRALEAAVTVFAEHGVEVNTSMMLAAINAYSRALFSEPNQ